MPEFIEDPATMTDYINCVESFLAEDYLRPAGLDLYDDCFKSPWFFPLQRQAEMRRMIQIARGINPTTVMEIGADKGAGVYHWVKCLPTVKHVLACEVRGVPYRELLQSAFPHVCLGLFPLSSYTQSTVELVSFSLNGPLSSGSIDILFIDGDKLGFLKDFDAYLPLMNSNGIVFMHDIQDREPRKDYNIVCSRGYRHEEIVDLSDTRAAMERARQGIPPVSAHEGWLRHWNGRSAGVGVIYLDGRKP